MPVGLSLTRRMTAFSGATPVALRALSYTGASHYATESTNPAAVLSVYVPLYTVTENGIVVTENGIPVHTKAMDITWEITGGADSALFDLSVNTGNISCDLEWISPPTHASPEDADLDNVYEVTVAVTYSGYSVEFPLTIMVLDPVVGVFTTAAGISDTAITGALNAFVTALKDASIWSSMAAIWPFVGGTAATHKWNLVDPQDLDASFRLSFTGTWTHSSTGANPDGTTSHANTFFVPSTSAMSSSAGAMGIYLRDNNTGGFTDIGASNSGGMELSIQARGGGSSTYMNYGEAAYAIGGANSDSRGLYTIGRLNGTQSKGWKNTTSLTTRTHAVTLPNVAVYLGARNANGATVQRSPNEIALAFMSTEAWSDIKQADMYTAVQALQTTLSRNV